MVAAKVSPNLCEAQFRPFDVNLRNSVMAAFHNASLLAGRQKLINCHFMFGAVRGNDLRYCLPIRFPCKCDSLCPLCEGFKISLTFDHFLITLFQPRLDPILCGLPALRQKPFPFLPRLLGLFLPLFRATLGPYSLDKCLVVERYRSTIVIIQSNTVVHDSTPSASSAALQSHREAEDGAS